MILKVIRNILESPDEYLNKTKESPIYFKIWRVKEPKPEYHIHVYCTTVLFPYSFIVPDCYSIASYSNRFDIRIYEEWYKILNLQPEKKAKFIEHVLEIVEMVLLWSGKG